MFELRRRPSGKVSGTPMKKLLADEMSKESESKRRSPSVIARLMGLDGLPSQQPAHKQQKRLSENCQQRTASVGFQRSDAPYEGRSFRKSSKEQQEFKDVFEVLETPKVESGSYTLQRTVNSKLTEAEMAFIRQKFMDVKRLSTDEKLQDSKEFHDALEVLDSNKDLLLKFLQEPDSMFTKHLHDLQGTSPQFHCGRVTIRKSADAPKYENNATGLKSDRETPCKNYISSPQRRRDGFLSHSNNRGTHNALKSSKLRIEAKDETSALPTRIVVLKPNLGKAQNVTKSVPSPHSSHAFLSDCRMHTEFPGVKSREPELWGKNNNVADDVGFSRHKSRESREIAKEITRKMRNSFTTGSMNFSSSGFRGYAGDESSCYSSGNDSANESEASTLTSRNTFDWNNRHRPSLSHSSDSSVTREARKRLSERWKMTHEFQEVGVAGRGSTLGEMLAIPDRGMRPEELNTMIGQDDSGERSSSIDVTAGWVDPLGISSRDGWKDDCVRNLSRSKSLPSSSAALGSPKISMRRETFGDDRFLVPKEAMNRGRNKAVNRTLNRKDGSFSRNLRSSSKKSQSSHHSGKEGNEKSEGDHLCQNQVKNKPEEEDPSEQKPMVSETSVSNVRDTRLVLDAVLDVEHENNAISPISPEELIPEPSACTLVKDDSSTHDVDNSISQETSNGPSEEGSVPLNHPILEPESPASSKEADQPSPVSILEAPFTDDLSSGSECFGSLSADLQGLRMQLQLLKLESEAYEEGPMVISSDEDVGEGSVGVSEARGMFRAEESWESSYVVDVLIYSGFSDADPDMFLETWQSPECPVGPLVFEKLEKKYCDQTTSLKSERKLLFDRINSGLREIFQQFMDPHPWVKPLAIMVGPKMSKDGLEDDLCKLLSSEEKKGSKTTEEKVLGKESEWLDLGEDIDVIGRELERLLIDELVAEAVNM
ncbi:hypothetical protein L1049_008140 [Liquidambar formosana]|uniref:DUF4378 domain-containing protein n=1 Tax=Liquidambar formosana TaxID=63359 RepID=A0AAP0S603_LIQFO